MRILLVLAADRIFGCNVRMLDAVLRREGHEPLIFFLLDSLPETCAAAAREAAEQTLDAVGFSVMTDVFRTAAMLSRSLRETLDVPVLWGGIHTTLDPGAALEYADYAFLGEADQTLPIVLESFAPGRPADIDGVASPWDPADRKPVFSAPVPDLDALPFPSLNWAAHTVFTRGCKVSQQAAQERLLDNTYHAVFSRGCPYNCTYCYNNVLREGMKGKGPYFRRMSIPRVMAELRHAAGCYQNLERVFIWDDNFMARPDEELLEFAEAYKSAINKPFGVLGHPQNVKAGTLRTLKQAGLSYFQMGIESGSDDANRRIYGRRVSRAQILDAARTLHATGLDEVRYDIILNNPFETPDHVRETAGLLAAIPKPYHVNGYNLVFFPGTVLYRAAMDQGLISLDPHGIDPDDSLFATRNSPLLTPLGHAISRKLYAVHYDDRDRRHLNLLIFLIACTRVPRSVIIRLLRSPSPAGRALPELLTRAILAWRRIRRAPRPEPASEKAAPHE